jgi:hypothetical protein
MIINDEDTPLPEPVERSTCILTVYTAGDPRENPGSFARPIPMISKHELMVLRRDTRGYGKAWGTPVYCSIIGDQNNVLGIWPAPMASLLAHFRYCPVMKEI